MEQEVLEYWDQHKTFEKSLEKTKDKEPYVFYDGPPFATGTPHHGHILTSTIKDAIPRYQTMRGRYVHRRWGWDCHGLPIENIVEQKLGISGKQQIQEYGVEKFNAVCRESVWGYEQEWGKMVRRLARWVDFENSYKTMDTSYQESVWWNLQQLWSKQLIFEDRKVLLYCPRCETPISNFEVAMDNSYKDVTENSVYVKFRLLPSQRIVDWMTDEKTYVLAWTTTPWTLPGNTALHVGPTLEYVLVQQGEEKFILAKERLDLLAEGYEVIREVSPRSLAGIAYEPLYRLDVNAERWLAKDGDLSRAHKIYVDDFVATTEGTGVVHSAVMHGEEDFLAAKEHDLPRIDMLDHKGHYMDLVPEFLRGMFFKKAERPVLEDLGRRGLVFQIKPFTHSYPHCWRCSTPLYYNALPAWFINIQQIKQSLLKSNEQVEWYPDHLKHGRFQKGLEGAPDWNISRNRFWATALPFWKCTGAECRTVVCVGSVGELISRAKNFAEVYPNFQLPVANFKSNPGTPIPKEELEKLDLHKPYIDRVILQCEQCQNDMVRVPEVVDCWVESGSMPSAELHYPFEHNGSTSPEDFKRRFPADFVVEYTPQTRAWFYVMHVINTVNFGEAPFRNVLCHGTILAEDGSKMSKSKKNYPDPWLIVDRYGADALRFYLLSSPVVSGEELNFSEQGVKEVSQKVNMLLYNVWSFYRMYSAENLQPTTYNLQPKHVLDKWVLERLKKLVGTVTYQLDHYNTVKACREIVEFINELSTWYVRRSRERIKANDESSKQALQTLGYVLARTAQVLAPIAPFLSEKIYRDVTGEESVHLSEWPMAEEGSGSNFAEASSDKQWAVDSRTLEQMDLVREVVSLALAARKSASVSVRQPLAQMAYKAHAEVHLSEDHVQIILEELNIKSLADFDSLAEQGQLKGGVVQATGAGAVSVVALDTVLTPELTLEGYARELERVIQDLRKKSGLTVGDEVDLYYNTTDADLEKVLLSLVDRKKTSVRTIAQSLEVEADNEAQANIDNKPIWVGIVKV